ncbi:MAG: zf-HC2 domain-containing protein [bacterium]
MRCSEVKRLLSAYFDGEIPTDKSIKVREHLKSCKSCAIELENIEKIHRLMGAFPILEVGPYFESQIIDRIEKENKRRKFSFGLKLTAGFAICGLIFFLMTFRYPPKEDMNLQPTPVLNTYIQEYMETYNGHIGRNNPGLIVSVSSLGENSR